MHKNSEFKKAFLMGANRKGKLEWLKFIFGLTTIIVLYYVCRLGREMIDMSVSSKLSATKIGSILLKIGTTEAKLPETTRNIGFVVLLGSMASLFILMWMYLSIVVDKLTKTGVNGEKE